VLQIADQIPSPVDLNQDTFGSGPLINALFVNGDKLFNTDLDVNVFLRTRSQYQAPVNVGRHQE
jgi:hypothetical protein